MARVVTGYDERGRPTFRDEGPARGRVGKGDADPLVRLGAAALPTRFLIGGDATHGEQGGAAQVERRQASDAQRAAWAAERADAAPHQPDRPMHMSRPKRAGLDTAIASSIAASRARGAARAGFVPGATKPYLEKRVPLTQPPPEEVPVQPPVALTDRPPIDASLDSTNDVSEGMTIARAEAEALEEAQAIVASEGARNIPDSIPGARPDPDLVTPCEDCAHAAVCRIKPTLVFSEIIGFTSLLAGVRVAAVSIDCDYFLERVPVAPAHVQIERHRIVGDRRADPVPFERSPAGDHGAHRASMAGCPFCADESFAQEPPESVTTAPAPDDAAEVPVVAPRPGGARWAAKLPRDPAEREALVLEAVRTTTSTTAASIQLGVSGPRVLALLHEMRRAGRLPDDVDEALRARGFGKAARARASVTAQA